MVLKGWDVAYCYMRKKELLLMQHELVYLYI